MKTEPIQYTKQELKEILGHDFVIVPDHEEDYNKKWGSKDQYYCQKCHKPMSWGDWYECSICIKCICDGINKV